VANWTVGDWITYGSFILGAFALALVQLVKDMQNPPDWIPSVFRSERWNYAPLLLMLVGAAAYGARQLAPISRLLDQTPKAIVQSVPPPPQVHVAPAPPPMPAPPTPLPKPTRFPADLARINDALFKIHGIIRTELMGPIDRFQGTIQDLGDGVPSGGYGPMLTKLKGYLSEIETAENDIKSVFEDRNYEAYSNDLREAVKPSGYYGNGRVNYHNDMLNFIRTMEMLSKKFPTPDGELNSVLSLLADKLGAELADYTTWASQTLQKIDAERSRLQQQ
jgi:hypothetical protein